MADYLTDEEQVDRIKKLWKDYGITVVLAIAIGIGGTVGWDYFKVYQAERAHAAADLYTSFMEASGLGEPTALFVDDLAANYGDSAYYVFTLLRLAKNAIDEGNYEEAYQSLTTANDVASGTPLGDLVALRKAKVEFELGEFDAVLDSLQTIETDGYQWQALMLKGDVHFQKNELDAARDAYKTAKEQMPTQFNSAPVDMRVASIPSAPP